MQDPVRLLAGPRAGQHARALADGVDDARRARPGRAAQQRLGARARRRACAGRRRAALGQRSCAGSPARRRRGSARAARRRAAGPRRPTPAASDAIGGAVSPVAARALVGAVPVARRRRRAPSARRAPSSSRAIARCARFTPKRSPGTPLPSKSSPARSLDLSTQVRRERGVVRRRRRCRSPRVARRRPALRSTPAARRSRRAPGSPRSQSRACSPSRVTVVR